MEVLDGLCGVGCWQEYITSEIARKELRYYEAEEIAGIICIMMSYEKHM